MSQKKTPFIGSIEPYRELFEEIEDVLLIVNERGKIEYVNRALRKQFGLKQKTFTGRFIEESMLFPADFKRKKILEKLFRERDFVTEVVYQKQPLFFSWKTKVFHRQKGRKIMAVVRNISSTIELQQKVHDYAKNLEDMVFKRTHLLEREKQKALELNHTKVIFLSRMSHELRTPLTAIRGYAELLQESQTAPEDREKYLTIIGRNAQRLLDMIDETLQMIRLEQHKYQILEQKFSLRDLLHDIVDTYVVLAQKKGLTLRYDLANDLPEEIYSDPNALRQILTNLIGNAIKFTEQGTVTLQVRQRTLAHSLGTKLYFSVEDTGLGIPVEHQRRIFKSFEQHLDHHTVHSRGTGLGLAISRHLSKLLGGNLKLSHSEPHQGSTFVFVLPLRIRHLSHTSGGRTRGKG